MTRIRSAMGGGGQRGQRGQGGRGRSGRQGQRSGSQFQFVGEYIVFALRDGNPTAVPIRTGLTDLDFSEVVRGLDTSDTVLLLPSAGLLQSQQEFQERISRFTGGGLTSGGRR